MLLNDKGGNLITKAGYVRNRLQNLKDLDFSICAESYRIKFEFLTLQLFKKFEQMNQAINPKEMLVQWWLGTKKRNKNNLDKAGYEILKRNLYHYLRKTKCSAKVTRISTKSIHIMMQSEWFQRSSRNLLRYRISMQLFLLTFLFLNLRLDTKNFRFYSSLLNRPKQNLSRIFIGGILQPEIRQKNGCPSLIDNVKSIYTKL